MIDAGYGATDLFDAPVAAIDAVKGGIDARIGPLIEGQEAGRALGEAETERQAIALDRFGFPVLVDLAVPAVPGQIDLARDIGPIGAGCALGRIGDSADHDRAGSIRGRIASRDHHDQQPVGGRVERLAALVGGEETLDQHQDQVRTLGGPLRHRRRLPAGRQDALRHRLSDPEIEIGPRLENLLDQGFRTRRRDRGHHQDKSEQAPTRDHGESRRAEVSAA